MCLYGTLCWSGGWWGCWWSRTSWAPRVYLAPPVWGPLACDGRSLEVTDFVCWHFISVMLLQCKTVRGLFQCFEFGNAFQNLLLSCQIFTVQQLAISGSFAVWSDALFECFPMSNFPCSTWSVRFSFHVNL